MQEGRVVDPQARTDDRVVLVTGRADGVEAAVRLLQLARRDVELARRHLVLEQRQRGTRRRPTVRAQRFGRLEPMCRGLRGLEIGVELSLDDGDAIPGHSVADDSADSVDGRAAPFYPPRTAAICEAGSRRLR